MKEVLILENDSYYHNALTQLLKEISPKIEIQGFNESSKSSKDSLWKQAWNKIQPMSQETKAPYQLIVSELTLSQMSPIIEFWKNCQKHFPHVPFLFTSSLPSDEFFELFGNSIVCPPFLSKPFILSECRQIIRILLETELSHPNDRVVKGYFSNVIR